jgi:hypothetical protein
LPRITAADTTTNEYVCISFCFCYRHARTSTRAHVVNRHSESLEVTYDGCGNCQYFPTEAIRDLQRALVSTEHQFCGGAYDDERARLIAWFSSPTDVPDGEVLTAQLIKLVEWVKQADDIQKRTPLVSRCHQQLVHVLRFAKTTAVPLSSGFKGVSFAPPPPATSSASASRGQGQLRWRARIHATGGDFGRRATEQEAVEVVREKGGSADAPKELTFGHLQTALVHAHAVLTGNTTEQEEPLPSIVSTPAGTKAELVEQVMLLTAAIRHETTLTNRGKYAVQYTDEAQMEGRANLLSGETVLTEEQLREMVALLRVTVTRDSQLGPNMARAWLVRTDETERAVFKQVELESLFHGGGALVGKTVTCGSTVDGFVFLDAPVVPGEAGQIAEHVKAYWTSAGDGCVSQDFWGQYHLTTIADAQQDEPKTAFEQAWDEHERCGVKRACFVYTYDARVTVYVLLAVRLLGWCSVVCTGDVRFFPDLRSVRPLSSTTIITTTTTTTTASIC